MPTVVIISPDPEARRMFQLGFELQGCTVEPLLESAEIDWTARPEAIVIDVVEDAPELWRQTGAVGKKAGAVGTATVLVLPRGHAIPKLPKGSTVDLFVKRPFELISFIKGVRELFSSPARATAKKPAAKKPPARKKSPSPKPRHKKTAKTKKAARAKLRKNARPARKRKPRR